MEQRILAIDDEFPILKLLERIIRETTPYGIRTTNNVLELPGILAGEEFDLIITDLKMPGMDGLEVLRMVRNQGRPEAVIIITAFGSLDSALEAISLGVFDYITKPFKKEQIIHAVEGVMDFQNQRRRRQECEAILELEPYEAARRAFEALYARRLAERCHDDEPAMIERSGMSRDLLARSRRDGAMPAERSAIRSAPAPTDERTRRP